VVSLPPRKRGEGRGEGVGSTGHPAAPLPPPRPHPERIRGPDQRAFRDVGKIGGGLDFLAALRPMRELLAHQGLGPLRGAAADRQPRFPGVLWLRVRRQVVGRLKPLTTQPNAHIAM
jgi:hypothetical protein